MQFFCPCKFQQDFEDEKSVEEHMKNCQVYFSKSPLSRYTSSCSKLSNEQNLTLRIDLRINLERVELELKQRFCNEKQIKKELIQCEYQEQIQFEQKKLIQCEQLWQSDQKITCECCRSQFSDQDIESINYLEKCVHMVCKKCIYKMVQRDYILKQGRIVCCEIACGQILTRNDMEGAIGKDSLNELDEKLALTDQNIVTCVKCKSKYGFEDGNSKEIVKDQQGKQLTGQPLDHYIHNRFICRDQKCKTEQCKTCAIAPYHTGYTCEDFILRQKEVKCRLCDNPVTMIKYSQPEARQKICHSEECFKRAFLICTKKLQCGHFCQGMNNEINCLPCLEPECTKNINKEDYCPICFTESLKSAACVQSECGHMFHYECVIKKLKNRWNGPRIVFNYTSCTLCKSELKLKGDFKEIDIMIDAKKKLKALVTREAIERLEIEGRMNDKELKDPQHQYFRDYEGYALAIFCFYECYKCSQPYFGGLRSCQNNIVDDQRQFNKEDLICTDCCPITFEKKCKTHGNKYIEFKCRYCCSPAIWFCFGNTHFCDLCHQSAGNNVAKECKGAQSCPLRVDHIPNGQECSLGCAVCRNKRMEIKN